MNALPHTLVRTRQVALRGVDPRSSGSGFVKVRHGVYLPRVEWDAASPARRYELYVRATVESMRVTAPLGRESAAVLLGIPVIGVWPKVTHVVEETGAGGRRSTHVVRHGTRFLPEVTLVDGIAVTSAARTVVDLGRARSFASGLASTDFALRHGLVTRAALEEEVERLAGTRGIQVARAVVEHADGRAESVGESLSRAQMVSLALPLPELQEEFFDEQGLIGRSDFWWPEIDLIGEFDGRVKFGRDVAATAKDAREALWQEKLREAGSDGPVMGSCGGRGTRRTASLLSPGSWQPSGCPVATTAGEARRCTQRSARGGPLHTRSPARGYAGSHRGCCVG